MSLGSQGLSESSTASQILLLTKSLQLHRPKKARPVWAWWQRDKISCSWLLALPRLNTAEFSEAAATNLCIPSPACAGRVGEVIKGRSRIDEYGDKIQAAGET